MEKTYRKNEMKFRKFERDQKIALRASAYRSGAAESATLPPEKCPERDTKAAEILGFIESEALDKDKNILVNPLAELFLVEQNRVRVDDAVCDIKTRDDLISEIRDSDIKHARKIQRRLKLRYSKKIHELRIYGWDRHSDILKAPFFAWSMNRARSRAFTVNFTKEAVQSARDAKKSTTSHFLDRLQSLLRRRFGVGKIEFWFGIEYGTKGGLHAHGVISWSDDIDDQNKIIDALKVWSGGQAPNQIRIDNSSSQAGWATYIQKNHFFTKRIVKGQTFAATSNLRKRAKALFGEFHSEYRRISKAMAVRG